MTSAKLPGGSHRTESTASDWTKTILTFVKWCQGRTDIQTNLNSLSEYFKADAVGLSRWCGKNQKLRTAGFINRQNTCIDVGFADIVCGSFVNSIKPGAALLLSEVTDNNPVSDPRLAQYLYQADIAEIGVICFAANGQTRDFVEFHFRSQKLTNWDQVNRIQGPSFADVFAGRNKGLLLETILQNGQPVRNARNKLSEYGILSHQNPAGLTRCEWRICALIANGLSRKGIAKELSVKPCTVQSHLRNIYAKTEYDRFHELALHLVQPGERAHLLLNGQATAA